MLKYAIYQVMIRVKLYGSMSFFLKDFEKIPCMKSLKAFKNQCMVSRRLELTIL